MDAIFSLICSKRQLRLAAAATAGRFRAPALSFTPLPLTFSLFICSPAPLVSPPTPDNFPQMAHQKRFIERKYRQELKEMRREREQQEKESDDEDDGRK